MLRRFREFGRNRHAREILRGAGSAMSIKLVAAACAFAFNLLLTRSLGAEGAGLFFLALMVVSIAAVIARLGLDHALLRHMAACVASGHWASALDYYRLGMKAALVAAVTMSLVVFYVADHIAIRLFSEPALTLPLQIMAASILPFALAQLHGQALRSLKRIVAALSTLSLAVPLGSVLVLVPLVTHFGVNGAAASHVVASLAALLIGFSFWKHYRENAVSKPGHSIRSTLAASAWPLFFVSLLQLLTQWIATFFLGIYTATAEVGLYNAAHRSAVLIGFILIAVNAISAPKFSALHETGDQQGLRATANSASTIAALAAAPVALLMLMAPVWLMSWFGPEFRQAGTALQILAVGQYFSVAMGSVGNLLMMCGMERAMRNCLVISVGVNVVLCFVLIPQYGAMGAAIATAAGLIAQNIVAALYVRQALGFLPLPFASLRRN